MCHAECGHYRRARALVSLPRCFAMLQSLPSIVLLAVLLPIKVHAPVRFSKKATIATSLKHYTKISYILKKKRAQQVCFAFSSPDVAPHQDDLEPKMSLALRTTRIPKSVLGIASCTYVGYSHACTLPNGSEPFALHPPRHAVELEPSCTYVGHPHACTLLNGSEPLALHPPRLAVELEPRIRRLSLFFRLHRRVLRRTSAETGLTRHF